MIDYNEKMLYLQFVQNTITRMASNSFFCKGWLITLVAAFFAIVAENNTSISFLILVIVVLLFWWLDAFFLRQERLYRDLYNDAILPSPNKYILFDMNATRFKNKKNTYTKVIISTTLWPFYTFFTVVIGIMCGKDLIVKMYQCLI